MIGRIFGLCCISFALPGADHATVPWERNTIRVGQALYRENCVVCHEIDRLESKKFGPSFYRLFQRDKMPLSNTKPTRAYIKVRANFGGTLMPAFRQRLSDRDLDTLIDYIETK